MRVAVAAVVCLAWGGRAAAQARVGVPAMRDDGPVVLDRTEIHRFTSAVNGVEYELRLAIPREYGDGDEAFDVLVLLDADYSFAIARNVVDHLSDRDHLRPLLIVGVGYPDESGYQVNRTRDYTPWFSPSGGYGPGPQSHSGGAADFQRVLDEEVLAWLDAHWRTTGTRTLVGHSYGGLFAAWTFLTRPDLFERVLAVSPSLWYDGGHVFDLQRQVAAGVESGERPAPHGRIYLTVGDREVNGSVDMPADLARFRDVLRGPAWDGVRVGYAVGADETHNSIFPRALSDGLRWLLDGV